MELVQLAEQSLSATILGRFGMEALSHKRLAREIHDKVANHFVCANLLLGRVKARALDSDVRQSLDELNFELTQALSDLRSICFLLDSADLADHNWQDSLARLVHGFADRASLDLDFDFDLRGHVVSAQLQAVVVRIIQEALINVSRHSGAQMVQIRVVADGAFLKVEISDDGRGFSALDRPGVGIGSMVARAREIGGECQIDTSLTGTTVSANLPL